MGLQVLVLIGLALAVTSVGFVGTAIGNTPPGYASGYPTTSNVSTNGFNISVETNESTTVDYVVVEHNSSGTTEPSVSQIQSGENNAGDSARVSGNDSVSADTQENFTVSELSEYTRYDVYVVAQDGSGNTNKSARLPVLTDSESANFPIKTGFDVDSPTGWIFYDDAESNTEVSGENEPSLRLTDNEKNEAGTGLYGRSFPTIDGMTAEFRYYADEGNGADGFSFMLLNASQVDTDTFETGADGDKLGYGGRFQSGDSNPGVPGGFLGVGFDEYGGFADDDSCIVGGTTDLEAGVTIRGAGDQQPVDETCDGDGDEGYPHLVTTEEGDISGGSIDDGWRMVRVTTDPTAGDSSDIGVRVEMSFDGGEMWETVEDSTYSESEINSVFPDRFYLGFSGSTGGSTNIHAIDDLSVTKPANLTTKVTDAPTEDPYDIGDNVEYTVNVSNDGPNDDDDITVALTVPTGESGLTDVEWDTDDDDNFDDATGGSTTVNLDTGESQNLSLRGTVGDDVTENLDHEIGATTSSSFSDPDPSTANESVPVEIDPLSYGEIPSCDVIDEAGSYDITNDLETGETCLRINASDVHIDGNSHEVSATGGSADAISINGSGEGGIENVTVENVTVTGGINGDSDGLDSGKIDNFGTGIVANEVADSTLTEINATDSHVGVYLNESENVTVTNSTLDIEYDGLGIRETTNSTFAHTIAPDNGGSGVQRRPSGSQHGVDNNTYWNVTVENSGDSALVVGTNATVAKSTVDNPSGNGIVLDADSTVQNSTMVDTGASGIQLVGSADDATINDTTVTNAGTEGLDISSKRATIRNLTVETAANEGVLVEDKNATIITSEITDTGAAGILFKNGASDGVLEETTVSSTVDDALDVDATSDVAIDQLNLTSATISADALDATLNTSTAIPAKPGNYQSGVAAVNASVDGELENFELSYDASAVDIDEDALALWRHGGSDWSRKSTSVDTTDSIVAARGTITDGGTFTTFASNVSVETTDTTVDAGESGEINVTATNTSGAPLEDIELNISDDDGLGELDTGDTATTGSDGEASFAFQETSGGNYDVDIRWDNDTSSSNTATVTVNDDGGNRNDGDNGGGGGGGGGTNSESSETSVTVGADADDDTDDDSGESAPDTGISVSNPQPGQTLVIEGGNARIEDGTEESDTDEEAEDETEEGGADEEADDGTEESDAAEEPEDETTEEETGGDGDTSESDDDAADGDGDAGDGELSSDVRADRLGVDINTNRDFTLSITTYNNDLSRSSELNPARSVRNPVAQGGALLSTRDRKGPVTAPEDIRGAAKSFHRATDSVSAGYVEIDHTLESGGMSGATFAFSVNRGYLDELGVDREDVVLHHQTDDGWVTRETEYVESTDSRHRFEATMPGFSVFAIGTGAEPLGVTAASLSESQVTAGEEATITATVTNRGQAEAEKSVALTVDGDTVDTTNVTLPGNEMTEVSFTHTPSETGEYHIAVGDTSAGSMTVSDPTTRWVVLLGVLVAATVTVLLWRRNYD